MQGSQQGLQGQEHPQPWDMSQEENSCAGTRILNLTAWVPWGTTAGHPQPLACVTQHKLLGVFAGFQ